MSDSESSIADTDSESDNEPDTLTPMDTDIEIGSTASGLNGRVTAKADPRLKHMHLAKCLPYDTESLEEMDRRLEYIARRLLDCVKLGQWDVGFGGWSRKLQNWMTLKYPMKKEMRIKLASLYYELAVMPGLDPNVLGTAAGMVMTLLRPKRLININDLRLDWVPLHNILVKELFPKRRKAGHTNVSTILLDMAEVVQRFFHPSSVDAMLEKILPRLHGDEIDSILATQAFLVHFLPFKYPQKWLPLMFKLWEGINSGLWDEQMLDLLARLSVLHVNPKISDPDKLETIPTSTINTPEEEALNPNHSDDRDRGLQTPKVAEDAMDVDESAPSESAWHGVRKDIGIFTVEEFEVVMIKCLKAMGTPVGGALASAAAGSRTAMDALASKTILAMKKPTDRLTSLAEIIVYSMAEDSAISSNTGESTSGTQTPANPALARVAGTSKSNGMHISPSTDSLAAAGRKADSAKTYLAGSKALDHLAKLIMSCETFFHPSNHGTWSTHLTSFIQDLCWQFTKRWKEEAKAGCATPAAWRLTPKIKREFVLTIRPVALLSMFSKDGSATTSTRSALRSMSELEPDLIIMPIIERAVPSLQGLEETHRTTAVLKALGGISYALIKNPSGRMHLSGLLELSLPGIDMNDPGKTISTVVFLMSVLQHIRLGDISREPPSSVTLRPKPIEFLIASESVEQPDGDEPMFSPEAMDEQFRESTALFPNWLSLFVSKIFSLYEAMPEDSDTRAKGGATSEEQVVAMVNSCLECILANLDDDLVEQVMQQIYDYVTTSVRSNCVRVINGLISALSNARPEATLAKFYPICKSRILTELQYGASSTRTTATTLSIASDSTMHWYMAILYGTFSSPGVALLTIKDDLLPFLSELVDNTYSESGWSWSGRLLEKVLANLCTTFTLEGHLVNNDEWQSDSFRYRHSDYWGEQYKFSDVKVSWHVPSEAEVEFAIQIFDNIFDKCLGRLETVLEAPTRDKVWHNDLCRNLSYLRYGFSALNEFYLEHRDLKTGGKEASDWGFTPAEFMDSSAPVACGFITTDPSSVPYQRIWKLRARYGNVLHSAAGIFKQSNEDGFIDGLRLTVRSIGTWSLRYGAESKSYDRAFKGYTYLQRQGRRHAKQKDMSRYLWIRRMELYHQTRLRLNATKRIRSAMDDTLIGDLLDMSLSLFVRVRRSAQGMLGQIANAYDGTKALCLPILLKSLEIGVDPDVMKGALYVLGGKSMSAYAVREWRFFPEYITKLLQCQHQEKPSIQGLVGKIIDEAINQLREPMSLLLDIKSPMVDSAISRLDAAISSPATPESLLQSVLEGVTTARQVQDGSYDAMIPTLLAIAQKPGTHWRYTVAIARLLRSLIRRDKPTDGALVTWFMSKITDAHPSMRSHSQNAITRILYFIKLRALCEGSDERLFLQECNNPLKRKLKLTDTTAGFTDRYLAAFREDSGSEESAEWMQDKQAAGWLCWSDEMVQTRLAGWDERPFEFESTSSDAVQAIRAYVQDPEWWKSVAAQWSQEKTRKYLSADNIDLLRSLCQIFVDEPFVQLRPLLDEYLEDTDKDKSRAAAELLAGLLRGSKHWPGRARSNLWEWLTPKLPKIYANIRHDTFEYWKMFFEHVLYQRDPRRLKPILDFVLETGRNCEFAGASAFELKKNVQLVSSAIRCLAWRFGPWADEFIELYFSAVANDYVEVRGLVAANIMLLDNVKWHPSYPSVPALMNDCLNNPGKDVMGVHGNLNKYLDQLVVDFPKWRAERPSGAKSALSTYDKTGSTVTRWLYSALADTHAGASFQYVLPLIPEILQMREMVDNDELPKMAALLLIYITAVTPPVELVEPLITTLVKTLKESTSWKVRLHALPIVSIIYYRGLPLISEACAAVIMDALSALLQDENTEVRETAAATLSGVLRCSRRSSIVVLKNRFIKEAKAIKLPPRRDASGGVNPLYQPQIIKLHGAILGMTALIEAFPYDIPSFLPSLLTENLAEHASDPTPISTTIRQCAANFVKTHSDSWRVDEAKFTSDQLSNLQYIVQGASYYA